MSMQVYYQEGRAGYLFSDRNLAAPNTSTLSLFKVKTLLTTRTQAAYWIRSGHMRIFKGLSGVT